MLLNLQTNQNVIQNFLRAAVQGNAVLIGLAVKVRGNQIVNWSFVNTDTLKSLAAIEGELSFDTGDNPTKATQLKALLNSLSDDAPVLALMLRYKRKGATPEHWEFVDVEYLKNLAR